MSHRSIHSRGTSSEEDMGARNEFKDPPLVTSLFPIFPILPFSLSLSPSKLKRGKNTSLLFRPIFDSALLEIRGDEGEANEIWLRAFETRDAPPCVKELVTRPGKERFARYLAFYFNWISLLQPVSNLASLDRDKIGLLLLHVCVYVFIFRFVRRFLVNKG